MFRKNYFTFLLVTAVFLMSGIAAFAQNAPISGRVELTKADGTKAPVAGALVEVFRMDQKIKLPSDKTDKKGNFAFAGITLGGRYVLSVSGAGIAPTIYPNITAGTENIVVSVVEGDGRRYTEEEVKQSIASGANNTTTTTQQSKADAEEAKRREEEIRKQNEENEKVKKSNDVMNAALKEGNAAFEQKNYDAAIVKFQEGYDAAPTFVPAASVFMNNISSALIRRAGINFNAKKDSDKAGARESLKTDTLRAAEASEKVLEMLKTAVPKDEKQRTDFERQKIIAIKNRKEAYYLMVKFGEEVSKVNETVTAFNDYFAIETVAAEKLKTRTSFAEILLYIGEYDKALAEYETILTESPDNLDAMIGAGTALIAVGAINNNDKAKYQLAANYLQRFIDAAPDTNPKKAEAVGMLNTLKNDFKVTPQKKK